MSSAQRGDYQGQRSTDPNKKQVVFGRGCFSSLGVHPRKSSEHAQECGANWRDSCLYWEKWAIVAAAAAAVVLFKPLNFKFKSLRWRRCTRGTGSRVGVEGVRGRTDAGRVDGGQDALVSIYGSPPDKQ